MSSITSNYLPGDLSLAAKLHLRLASILEVSSSGTGSRFASMEGLRGLAILLVFLTHYYGIIWQKMPQTFSLQIVGAIWGGAGGTGVDLFFVLSGFLIYGAVRKRSASYFKFLRRRAVRIYPAFLCVLLLYLILTLVVTHPHADTADPYASRIPDGAGPAALYLLANVVFLPGIANLQPIMNVAWSLSYEWFFYLIVPPVVISLRLFSWNQKQRIMVLSAATFTFVALAICFPSFFYFPSALGETCYFRAMMFFGGMLVFELTEAGAFVTCPDNRLHELVAITLAVLAVAAVSGRVMIWPKIDFQSSFLVHLQVFLGVGLLLAYSTLVFVTLRAGTWFAAIFSWYGLRWLGNMSYSFYLVHGLPLHAVALLIQHSGLAKGSAHLNELCFVLALIPVFLITCICSMVLFAFVEKPFSIEKRVRSSTCRPVPEVVTSVTN